MTALVCLAVALVVAPVLRPAVAFAQNITTAGDCSPVIQHVGGNVAVTCYVDADLKPKFRVTYYRLGGIGQSFVINGKLSPEWEQYLGGQQAIVNNPVYDELRRITERFGTEIAGTHLSGSIAFLDGDYSAGLGDYARSVDPAIESFETDAGEVPVLDTDPGWRAFQSSSLFVPDIASAETLFNTPDWPASYEFVWGDANLPTAWVEPGAVLSAPTLWRYLTPSDLDGYEERYAYYFDRAVDVAEDAYSGADLRGRIASGRFSNPGAGAPMSADFEVLESIRYLTRNGMPEKFMVVEGVPGAHYGWAFTATSRGADLLIAILENVGERAVDVGTFRIDATDAMTIRTYSETTRLLDEAGPTERRLWPPGVLRPGEKLVIPVRIELPLPAELFDWYLPGYRDNEAAGESVRREAEASDAEAVAFVHPYATDNFLFAKATDQLPEGLIPDFVERFEYGPAWRIASVEIDGAYYDFREHDPNNFILFAGGGVGSCPYVYSYQPDSGLWLEEGHFLLGAISPDLKRTDELELKHFRGRLEIRETEHEVAYIDSLALKLRSADGTERLFPAISPAALAADDGENLILAHGDRAEVRFDLPDGALEATTASIVAAGFYVPFSRPDLIARAR